MVRAALKNPHAVVVIALIVVILGAVAARETNEFGDNGAEGRAIAAANEAVAILDEWRVLKQAAGKTNFFPSLLTRG